VGRRRKQPPTQGIFPGLVLDPDIIVRAREQANEGREVPPTPEQATAIVAYREKHGDRGLVGHLMRKFVWKRATARRRIAVFDRRK
jgi:hypothetical protein